jgi:hypothetical protein
LAVGYERYDAGTPPHAQSKARTNGSHDLYAAVKKASFVEKAPAVLDEVAAFVKDVLAQFGLTENKSK